MSGQEAYHEREERGGGEGRGRGRRGTESSKQMLSESGLETGSQNLFQFVEFNLLLRGACTHCSTLPQSSSTLKT